MVIAALRKLGTNVTADKLRDYLAHQRGALGLFGSYDFQKIPQRGLDDSAVLMVRWDPAKNTWIGSAVPAVRRSRRRRARDLRGRLAFRLRRDSVAQENLRRVFDVLRDESRSKVGVAPQRGLHQCAVLAQDIAHVRSGVIRDDELSVPLRVMMERGVERLCPVEPHAEMRAS